jgi:tetratricopeptide (TPR) repeat protein
MRTGIVALLFVFVWSTTLGQHSPKKPSQLFEEAETAYDEGNFQEALTLLNECLKMNAGYMDAYPLRAGAREQLKDLDGALTDYSIYLDRYPEHPDVLMSRAVLRFNLGFFEHAKEDFRKLMTISSPETNAVFFRKNMSVDDRNPVMTTTNQRHNSLVLNYLGLIESKLKNPRLSIVYLDSAIRLDPKEPDYYVNRGLAKEALEDSLAFLDYEHALRLNPNHTLAKHNLEAFLGKKQQMMSEEERLTRTIKIDSTMLFPYLERAQQRYEGGYYKGALEDYDQALGLDPSNVEVWFARGLTKEKLKDYEGAFSDYTKAIDLKEDYAKVWLSRGNVLLKLDRFNDAIEDYNVALVYYSDYAPAYYNRAMAKVKLKKNEEACIDLKRAEELGMSVEKKIKSKICK